jgi:predicted membrane protein
MDEEWRQMRHMRRMARMQRHHHYHGPSSAVGGAILLAVGAVLLLDRLGIVSARDIFQFWPMALVAVGLAALTRTSTLTGRLWSGMLIAAGLLLQAANLGYIHVRGELFWPFVLIAIGVLLLGRALESRDEKANATAPPADSTRPWWVDYIEEKTGASEGARFRSSVVFSSREHRVTAPNFERAKIEAVFGSYELDLREAGLAGDEARVVADAVFGSVEIFVPEDWEVDLRGEGVFGSVSDETRHPGPNPSGQPKRLVVKGAAVFGSVEVSNRPRR